MVTVNSPLTIFSFSHQTCDSRHDEGEEVVSADMMKVTVIPILPMKENIFTSRLAAFNETFAVLISQEKGRKTSRRQL